MATAIGHQGALTCRGSIDMSHIESNTHQVTTSHANHQKNPTLFDFKPSLSVQYWTPYVFNSVQKGS